MAFVAKINWCSFFGKMCTVQSVFKIFPDGFKHRCLVTQSSKAKHTEESKEYQKTQFWKNKAGTRKRKNRNALSHTSATAISLGLNTFSCALPYYQLHSSAGKSAGQIPHTDN